MNSKTLRHTHTHTHTHTHSHTHTHVGKHIVTCMLLLYIQAMKYFSNNLKDLVLINFVTHLELSPQRQNRLIPVRRLVEKTG